MNKLIVGLVFGLLLTILTAGQTRANEGVFELGSSANSGASCYILSVFDSGRYKVTGTCRNLTTPFSGDLNRYVLWYSNGTSGSFRVGEVRHGKIDGSISSKFDTLFVSAESKSAPRKPSEMIVARGAWQAVPLVGEEVKTPSVTVTPTPTAKAVDSSADAPKTQSGVARFLGTLGRVIGIGFLVLLIGVIVMTIVTRRKEQA